VPKHLLVSIAHCAFRACHEAGTGATHEGSKELQVQGTCTGVSAAKCPLASPAGASPVLTCAWTSVAVLRQPRVPLRPVRPARGLPPTACPRCPMTLPRSSRCVPCVTHASCVCAQHKRCTRVARAHVQSVCTPASARSNTHAHLRSPAHPVANTYANTHAMQVVNTEIMTLHHTKHHQT